MTGRIWTVGEVSTELDLPSSTIRTWERRYGLNPSVRTAGGHRRYDSDDVERLRLMTDLVNQGVTPAEAAGVVRRSMLAGTTASSGSNKAARERWSDEVLDATRQLDAARIHALLKSVLSEHGAKAGWMF
ncbi:MAG: MerR family transcriptional regulator, partial [Actinomycetales bacterium]